MAWFYYPEGLAAGREGDGEKEIVDEALFLNYDDGFSARHHGLRWQRQRHGRGINGKTVELLKFDDKGDGVEAINAYNLAREKGAIAVIGSTLTSSTIALADSTFEDNVPLITPTATSVGVTLIDPEAEEPELRTNVFRSCYTDPFQGEKMASSRSSPFDGHAGPPRRFL